MSTTDIREKIAKLLALKESSNPNEAEAAWSLAQKLMTKHRLSLFDVQSSKVSEEEIKESLPFHSRQNESLWHTMLADVIAEENNCKFFVRRFRGNRKIDYHLAGTQTDIDICVYLFESIQSQIEYLCKIEMQKGAGNGKAWSNAFKHGATSRVRERLSEGKKQALLEIGAEDQGSKAIVLMETLSEKVELWAEKNLGIRSRKINRRLTNSASGFAAGKQAGDKIDITANKTKGLLK